ncbi:hypothetical protein BG006_002228 [Podila minutissima]|uniref:Uncharacterized protein n=1 Tax=Podila minutissima TaxID=64525 RepID=A0A9P5SXC2_9FUNG|nr:hypothetical protein BG006_002228 [Podila minutissima]
MDTSVPTLDVQKSHPGILEVEDGIDLVRYIDCQGRSPILDLVGPKVADYIACNVEGRSRIHMASHSDHTIVSCLGRGGDSGGMDGYKGMMGLPYMDARIVRYDRVDRARDANLVVLRKDTTSLEEDRQCDRRLILNKIEDKIT